MHPKAPNRRLRRWVIVFAPLLAMLSIEAMLQIRVSQGKLPRLLSMTGLPTVYDDCNTLPELFAQEGYNGVPGMQKGDFYLNHKSLRTPDYTIEKPQGTQRVVVLGDSHSFNSGGVPTPFLWDRRLAAELREHASGPFEFINLAIPAVGPCFEQRMWQLEGSRLQPDLVILAFSISNDFLEMPGGLADRTLVDSLARDWLSVRLVRNLSRLWATETPRTQLETKLSEAAEGVGVLIPGAENRYDRLRPFFDVAAHEHIVYSRMAISDPTRTELFETALLGVKEILRQLRDDVEALDAHLIVLAIPAEHQVDSDLLTRVAQANQRHPEEFDTQRAQRELRQLCDALNVPFVDPLEEVRVANSELSMYRIRETHMNDLGHKILADKLWAFLERSDWLQNG